MNRMPIGCRSMRDGITVSLVFAVMALTMLLAAHFLLVDWVVATDIARALGAALLSFAPLILIGTYLRNRPAGDS
jgi:hypothetical protein